MTPGNQIAEKEDIHKFFEENSKFEPKKIVELAVSKFGLKESTIYTYFLRWRKEWNKPKKATKAELIAEVNKEMQDKGKESHKTINVSVDGHVIAQGINLESEAAEIVSKPKNVIIKPIMFQGPIFTYTFTEEGPRIQDGDTEFVTAELIAELLEIRRIWENQYLGGR